MSGPRVSESARPTPVRFPFPGPFLVGAMPLPAALATVWQASAAWSLQLALVVLAVAPPLAFAFWVRHVERHAREPVPALLLVFLWGGVGGVGLAYLASIGLARVPLAGAWLALPLAFPVLVAPLVEETTKSLGLWAVPDNHAEAEDGLVYGAFAGFGFAAVENVLYQSAALRAQGAEIALATVAIRTLSTILMHAGASALVGYAAWRVRFFGARWTRFALLFGCAVALHAVFNYVAAAWALGGLAVGIVLAQGMAWLLRRLIRAHDARSGPHA